MFVAFARFSYRFRWLILITFLVLAPVAGIYGGGVFKALKSGGFDNPGSQSYRTRQQLAADLGAGQADIIALYTVSSGAVDSPNARAAVTAALQRAAQDASVEQVTSYYASGAPQLVSKDRSQTFAVLSLRGDDQAKADAVDRLRPELRAEGLHVQLGGNVPVASAINKTVESDLRRAELIAFPITAVLLVLIFGSLVSAGVPLLLGGLAIILAFTAVHIIASLTDVSVFALNIITVLGLGLAIDYSLFILNRYREELPARGPEEALIVAISTTGRAVAFSGVTLAASLSGLFVFPQMFLRSMALGGIAVTLVAVVISLTLLPALIAVLGRHIEALHVPWLRRTEAAVAATETGFWHRLAVGVMRHPVAIAVSVTAVLLLFASPFLRFHSSTPDVRVLSPSFEARQVSDMLDSGFRPHEATPHDMILTSPTPVLAAMNIGNLYDYVQHVAALPGVARVDSVFSAAPGLPRESYQALYSRPQDQPDAALVAGLAAFARGNYTRLSVVSTGEIDSQLAQDQVRELRRLQPPAGMTVLVGGQAANLTDLKSTLRDRIPVALLIAGSVMFAVLFLVFGSVTLPIKAMVMNLLSLSASFGAMVWIFQDGRLQGLLRFTSLGSVDATQPILLFAVVFGLSMDYEVLLLSRIREEFLRTGDNTLAVAHGLERTGRLITSAAALLVVVIGAFATSSTVFMKELGVGMALAVALDATVVRALLVPATMRLMGHWNWWAPQPMLHIWRRAGLGDLEGHTPAPASAGD